MISTMLISIICAFIVSFVLNEIVFRIFYNQGEKGKQIRYILLSVKIFILLILTLLNIIYSHIFNFELMMFLPGAMIHSRFSDFLLLLRKKIKNLLIRFNN